MPERPHGVRLQATTPLLAFAGPSWILRPGLDLELVGINPDLDFFARPLLRGAEQTEWYNGLAAFLEWETYLM